MSFVSSCLLAGREDLEGRSGARSAQTSRVAEDQKQVCKFWRFGLPRDCFDNQGVARLTHMKIHFWWSRFISRWMILTFLRHFNDAGSRGKLLVIWWSQIVEVSPSASVTLRSCISRIHWRPGCGWWDDVFFPTTKWVELNEQLLWQFTCHVRDGAFQVRSFLLSMSDADLRFGM